MRELDVVGLYNNSDVNTVNRFSNQVNSSLHVNMNVDKVEGNYEWLTLMEDTVMYLDNILRNPNRFIVNEEEIVKIEKAKRVTVESIKHLSRNTNFIQDYDKKTGDVKPSKILNINKEENFNTYENRFIYTVIQNMKMYIARKESKIVLNSSYKNTKKLQYQAMANVGKEKVNVNINLDSALNNNEKIVNSDGNDIGTRIEKLKQRVNDLSSHEVYKTLTRLHVALVTSPIKKTNVILKNVNFQYAVKLWNYMQENVDDESSVEDKSKNDFTDNGKLKQYFDDAFLLDYLAMSSLDGEGKKEALGVGSSTEVVERMVGNIVEKLIDINQEISETQLKEIVAKQFTVIKYKQVVTDKKIQMIFKNAMDKYLNNINKLKFVGDKNEKQDKATKKK